MRPMDFIKLHQQEIAVIAALFGGGLAGAVFAQVISWWRQPILRVVFNKDDRGCALDTPAELHTQGGNVVPGQQRYLRIRINNEGRSTAHGVSLCVTEITFYPVVGGASTFDEEVLELPVALSTRVSLDLARDGYRYFDLFCTEDFGNGVQFRFAFMNRPGRLYLRQYGHGSYSAKVLASSNNSPSKPATVSWHWDGTLAGLHIP
jgi:hypothetical protein